MSKEKGVRLHVRLTNDEHKKLDDYANSRGESIQEYLKICAFSRSNLRPLMLQEDARRVLIALNQIGNNANQIARKLNSGFREGFHPVIDEVRDGVEALRKYVVGIYGNSES